MKNTTPTFQHGSYARLLSESGDFVEDVAVEEDHGDGRVTVRFLNSETMITTDAEYLEY